MLTGIGREANNLTLKTLLLQMPRSRQKIEEAKSRFGL
jgi:hypothetical protein